MNFELSQLFFTGIIYLMLLFFIAYATEQGWISARIARHPMVYTLSLGVYATSWSFYGSVGYAQTQGYNFLSIYLGVTLAFLLAPILLSPILRIMRDYQLTSLADLFAFRYQSQTAGVIVTLFMLAGTFPYIALQILAVTESASILTQEAPPRTLALAYILTLMLFAILFGARHVTPREKHDGLVVAIAFETMVKLFALGLVGMYALFVVFGGPTGLDAWLTANPQALENLYTPVRAGPWYTLLFLSFSAAFLLPRQFHMAFTENLNERSLLTAGWSFPLLLLLMNLFIPVILWAGTSLQTTTSADYYVLGITLDSGIRLLPFVVFIGGLSAASAMIIVTTVALSSMCMNHLVLPASTYPDPKLDLYKWILWGRRTLIVLIVTAGYGFYIVLGRNQGLVQLGLISFVAVAQFLPGMFGVLFWPRATRPGFISGLLAGASVWAVTLLFPLLAQSGIIADAPLWQVLNQPPGINHLTFATLASLIINSVLFFIVSLLTELDPEQSDAADSCRATSFQLQGGAVLGATSPQQFKEQLARILGDQAASEEVRRALTDLRLNYDESDPVQLRRLRERIERNLSGLLGPMLSRMIVDERLQMDSTASTALADNIRLIETRLALSKDQIKGVVGELDQLRRYHQQILQDLPLAACAVDANGNVVSWNLAMELLSGLDKLQVQGQRLGDLRPPWSSLLSRSFQATDNHLHKLQINIDGRRRWLNVHKASIDESSTNDQFGGVVILLEDLTDVHNLEGELAHAERLSSIGRLAAGVAHEIGNPVTGIACLAQNLQSETDDAQALEASQAIINQTHRISNIVHTLVSFSHGGSIAAGEFTSVPVHECIEEAVRLVRLSHAARETRFTEHCSSNLNVRADRPRLVQILVNLLSNAVDACAEHTEVIVETRVEGTMGVIRVRDQGTGIPVSLQDNIFEPFVTTKAPGKGTGLGLSVVYRIVQDHGGHIAIEHSDETGTTIAVRIPLESEVILAMPAMEPST